MTVSGSANDYTGVILAENVTPLTNSCPANIQAYTSFPTIGPGAKSYFVVGNAARWEGQTFPSVANSVYDSHKIIVNTDVLGLTTVNSCQAVATQIYTCGGHAIGTFTLTNSYSHGTFAGQPVTNVNVTKQ